LALEYDCVGVDTSGDAVRLAAGRFPQVRFVHAEAHRMPRSLRGLVLAGALVLAGCSVGGQEAREPAEQPPITKAQLAAMVLPRDELGTIAEGTKPAPESGPVANTEAAESSLDPKDTGSSLRSAGRLAGHKAYYGGSYLVALRKRAGLYLVGTEVELMEDRVYAAQYLHKQLGDFQRFAGKQDDGSSRAGVSSFQVTGVGDEAEGLVATSTRGKGKLHVSAVAFRRERVVAVAAIVRADTNDMQNGVRALAVKLDKRIQDVLAGRIAPEESPAPEKAQEESFEGKERLPDLTMAPKDLAPGLEPVAEGETNGDGWVGYHRTFGETVVGGSHLITVRAETRLYGSAGAAASAFGRSARTGREAYAREMARAFADQTDVTPTDIRVQALAKPRRGTAGVVVTFDLAGAKFRIVSILVRSGRMVESVSGVCRAPAFEPDDLRPVADRAQKRLIA